MEGWFAIRFQYRILLFNICGGYCDRCIATLNIEVHRERKVGHLEIMGGGVMEKLLCLSGHPVKPLKRGSKTPQHLETSCWNGFNTPYQNIEPPTIDRCFPHWNPALKNTPCGFFWRQGNVLASLIASWSSTESHLSVAGLYREMQDHHGSRDMGI